MKIEEQPRIRFRSREGFCLASLASITHVDWLVNQYIGYYLPAYFEICTIRGVVLFYLHYKGSL